MFHDDVHTSSCGGDGPWPAVGYLVLSGSVSRLRTIERALRRAFWLNWVTFLGVLAPMVMRIQTQQARMMKESRSFMMGFLGLGWWVGFEAYSHVVPQVPRPQGLALLPAEPVGCGTVELNAGWPWQ